MHPGICLRNLRGKFEVTIENIDDRKSIDMMEASGGKHHIKLQKKALCFNSLIGK